LELAHEPIIIPVAEGICGRRNLWPKEFVAEEFVAEEYAAEEFVAEEFVAEEFVAEEFVAEGICGRRNMRLKPKFFNDTYDCKQNLPQRGE
jgi:hypothetical protein